MNVLAQNLVVLVIVATACAYLANLAWQTVARRKGSSCGGCGTCPASKTSEPNVISLSPSTQSPRDSLSASEAMRLR